MARNLRPSLVIYMEPERTYHSMKYEQHCNEVDGKKIDAWDSICIVPQFYLFYSAE